MKGCNPRMCSSGLPYLEKNPTFQPKIRCLGGMISALQQTEHHHDPHKETHAKRSMEVGFLRIILENLITSYDILSYLLTVYLTISSNLITVDRISHLQIIAMDISEHWPS